MPDNIISNFTYFYYTLVICGIIGVFSFIYRKPINQIIEQTEEKSNGRVAH